MNNMSQFLEKEAVNSLNKHKIIMNKMLSDPIYFFPNEWESPKYSFFIGVELDGYYIPVSRYTINEYMTAYVKGDNTHKGVNYMPDEVTIFPRGDLDIIWK